MGSLGGRTAVVTGAGSGVGQGIASRSPRRERGFVW